jgi:hypothetical protein
MSDPEAFHDSDEEWPGFDDVEFSPRDDDERE